MNELANTEPKALSTLDGLAMQARMFAQNACMNLLHLGRVLSEARPLIPYGEFEGWCKQNARMSKRTAEQYMQAYAEFGLDTNIAALGTSKIIKLLPMSEDEREKLLAENDVAAMSTRQLDEAIKKQKQQLLKDARAEAKAEVDRLAETSKALLAENVKLRRDLQSHEADTAAMQELQDRYNSVNDELLALKSSQARGEAEYHSSVSMTPEAFTTAVNTFIGTCCIVPQMGRKFAGMTTEEKATYEKSLRVLEKWAESARQALDSITYEEAIIID